MILKKVTLHNFRGYKDAEIEIDDCMNVIIGKNDVGKSTVLDALEIFFNSEQVKMDSDDLNVKHDEDDEKIEIGCSFFVEDDVILLDTSVYTNLKDEYLYNADGLLEIVLSSTGGKKSSYYIKANYPKQFEKPLIQLKITELRKELEKRKGEFENYDQINKTICSEIRKNLYSLMDGENIEYEEKLIDTSKEDAKNVYVAIRKQFPIFFLFKADRENKDGDGEVQNPLKSATKNALKGIESELDEVKSKIETEVKKISEETIEKLKELDPEIAQNLRTSVNTKAWDSLFSFQLIDDKGIPLNKRGSGVRRLLLLSYLRAEAERRAKQSANSNIIYAIEEPETAQHPNYQKMIMETLITLSQQEKHQIIITTHTPEIAKMAVINQIIFIKKENGNPVIITNEEDKFRDVINTLGIHETLSSKVVLCVEGENDVNFLRNIGRIPELNNIVDLNSEDVSILPLHGGSLKQWIERNYLEHSNVKEVHLYDNDVQTYIDLVNEINRANDGRRIGMNTKRLEMENYIPYKLVEEEFDIDLSDYKDNWEIADIPKLLVGKINRKLGRNAEEKEKIIKSILNGRISKNITKDMLVEMGVYEEIETWFIKLHEFVVS